MPAPSRAYAVYEQEYMNAHPGAFIDDGQPNFHRHKATHGLCSFKAFFLIFIKNQKRNSIGSDEYAYYAYWDDRADAIESGRVTKEETMTLVTRSDLVSRKLSALSLNRS